MNDMEAIEFAFKDWLDHYGRHTARHWKKLSDAEVGILCDAQWKSFLYHYENMMRKPLDTRMLLPESPINGNNFTTWENSYTFRDGRWILDEKERIPQ